MELLVAENPDPQSRLPYLIRVPVSDGLVFATSGTWPRAKAVYCHPLPADSWPDEPALIESVELRSCTRRGAAIDVVDAHERYAYNFSDKPVTTTRQPLACGDYGLHVDGRLVAVVERKSLSDLSSSLLNGKLRYQLTELAALPRAAVVVEDRYSEIFALTFVRPAVVADALAELQVSFPTVPIVFCQSRKLAQEYTYRYLAAAHRWFTEQDEAPTAFQPQD